MRDSVPSARYSSICNVLRQWRSISLIPTYRIYRLYDIVYSLPSDDACLVREAGNQAEHGSLDLTLVPFSPTARHRGPETALSGRC